MPQGTMGMILGFLALEYGLIGEPVFVALIVTSAVTSLLSGSLVRWAMAGGAHVGSLWPARPAHTPAATGRTAALRERE
jgi:hypothetical protein